MSDDIIEYVVAHAGQSRRQFLVRLLATSAFAAPVIASFAIGGTSTSKRSPIDAGSNICGENQTFDFSSNTCVDEASDSVDDASNIDCGPNSTFDFGSNTCIDEGSNETDDGSNETDDGSNETEGTGSGIPSTL